VDGDQAPGADELVQLDVVDVAARAQLGGMEDDEDVVAVGPNLGHGVALDTRLDGQGMEPEGLGQQPGGRLVADGDVDPDQPVVAGQQRPQLLDRMLLDAVIGHKANLDSGCHANVHVACHLLELGCLRRSAPVLPHPTEHPDGAQRRLWWGLQRSCILAVPAAKIRASLHQWQTQGALRRCSCRG
jgi:hypothetical protein